MRAPRYVLPLVIAVALSSGGAADDKAGTIPEAFRGTWLLRLTSDDGGKTYQSGGGKAVCEVTATEVRFAEKVAYADQKMRVKSVRAEGAGPKATHLVTFDNGKAWRLSEAGGSLTAVMYDAAGGKLTETYRITCRKAAK